jgi:Fe2+ or Zn2+ uptake regulation protein
MDANEPLYVVCRNGTFILPESVYRALEALVTNGFVYLRQDDDTLTISTTRLAGGHRRPLNARVRVQMFRTATRLGIVDLHDSIRVMAINAAARVPSGSPPAVR